MGHHRAQHGLRPAAAAMRLQHENVAQPGEAGVIGDDAHQPDLRAIRRIQPDTKRMAHGALHYVAGDAGGPVAASEISVDRGHVEPRRIVGNQISVREGFGKR